MSLRKALRGAYYGPLAATVICAVVGVFGLFGTWAQSYDESTGRPKGYPLEKCGPLEHPCRLWASSRFCIWISFMLQGCAIVAFVAIMKGGRPALERGWKVIAILAALSVGFSAAACMVILISVKTANDNSLGVDGPIVLGPYYWINLVAAVVQAGAVVMLGVRLNKLVGSFGERRSLLAIYEDDHDEDDVESAHHQTRRDRANSRQSLLRSIFNQRPLSPKGNNNFS